MNIFCIISMSPGSLFLHSSIFFLVWAVKRKNTPNAAVWFPTVVTPCPCSGRHRCLRDEDHGKTWGRRVGNLQTPAALRKVFQRLKGLKPNVIEIGFSTHLYLRYLRSKYSWYGFVNGLALIQCRNTCILEGKPFCGGVNLLSVLSIPIKSTRKWSQNIQPDIFVHVALVLQIPLWEGTLGTLKPTPSHHSEATWIS